MKNDEPFYLDIIEDDETVYLDIVEDDESLLAGRHKSTGNQSIDLSHVGLFGWLKRGSDTCQAIIMFLFQLFKSLSLQVVSDAV